MTLQLLQKCKYQISDDVYKGLGIFRLYYQKNENTEDLVKVLARQH